MAGARRCARLAPTWGDWLAEISDAVLSVFFPSGCRICERLLTSASRVPIIGCEVCGLPLPWMGAERGGAAALPGLQGQNLRLRQGAKLCGI